MPLNKTSLFAATTTSRECDMCGILTDAESGRCAACLLNVPLKRQAYPPGDERFHDILTELGELHSKKSADYGRGVDVFANLRGSEELGIPAWKGAMVRMNDKVHRLKSFCLNGSLACEGVEDSLMDLAAYAVITLILFREATREKPNNIREAIERATERLKPGQR